MQPSVVRHYRFAAVCALILVSGCDSRRIEINVAPPAQVREYRLAFEDEFDTLALSPDGLGIHTWYAGIWFNRRKAPLANISVSSSSLRIVWTRDQGTFETSIETLALDKRRFRAWRYGYFEARMKWDVVKGAWPAFWLIPVEDATDRDVYDGIRKAGEIDIFEGQGDTPHAFYGTLHVWVNHSKDYATRPNAFHVPQNIDFRQYHTYGLRWIPGMVTWYLDNRPLHSEKTPAVFDKQTYFMVLGMQEGVNWKLGDLSGVTAGRQSLNVDWVRVWQK